MTKSATQLDAEIAEALSARSRRELDQQRRKSRLRPVEGLRIPADSRRALVEFWRARPALRKGCLDKYGFDPVDDEEDYWRFGLAEPDHADVLRAIRRNDDVFAPALVERWAAEELAHTRSKSRAASRDARGHAVKKRIPDAVRTSIEQHALELIERLYRRYATVGGKEPCVTVGLVADYLRQAHMPEEFRWAIKKQQRTWTRSILESMRRRGLLGSSFGATARCYEPK